jgi:hypothetical protein
MRAFPLVIAVILIAGCKDKAKDDYDKCVKWDGQGDLNMAAIACDLAVKADPDSPSGKAAAQKLPDLQARLDALNQAKQAQAAASASAQAAAQQAMIDKCQRWCVLAGPGVGVHCGPGVGRGGLEQCRDLEKEYVVSPGIKRPCYCDSPGQ